jgi:membrane-associated HD superfamily phosphohydrolase
MVEELVRAKINDGQLDDCALTLRELALVKESFTNTLRSMLHSRISYPKDEERSSLALKRAANDASYGGRVIPMPKRA